MIGVWKRSSQVSAPWRGVLVERGFAHPLLLDRRPRRLALHAQALDLLGQRPQLVALLAQALLAEDGVALAGDALLERRLELLLGARDGAGELLLALDQPLLFALPFAPPALDLAVLAVQSRGLLQVRFEPLAEDVEAAAAPGAGGRHQLAAFARSGEGRLRFVEPALEAAVALQPLGQLAAQQLAP